MIIKKLTGKTYVVKLILDKNYKFTDEGEKTLSKLIEDEDLDGFNLNLSIRFASFANTDEHLAVLNIAKSMASGYNLEIFFKVGTNGTNVSLIKKTYKNDTLQWSIQRLIAEMFIEKNRYKGVEYVKPTLDEFFDAIGEDTGDWEEDLDVIEFYDEDHKVKQKLDELGPRPDDMDVFAYRAETRQIIRDVQKLFENDLKADTK